ncbi:SDR family oxidoreductase [Ramlibacter sp. USB13]|uniref:SDR family oxidoreductase n=1 Tax=Ramlibacter cellulosilyticus TaxID=2764187 RepID=A0A923MRS0_9BURK|nr:SDR family oxidoreductase [Ramlibacter cellulosilyticus]MBC5784280.1 SDR family oxidoreductase [Ramlibacter cellulosilyticus]
MRILLTGATGFIGRAVAQALRGRGHAVVRALRHPPPGANDAIAADFSGVPRRGWWVSHLAGIDAVVNTVGILREQGGQSFRALHTEAPVELFQACAAAGVRTVVQVSALGADEGARSAYHRSKKAADDVLRSLPLAGAIVQPSLVYGPGGTSAALFNKLAVAPVLPFPQGGRMAVQPVHVDDVVQGIVRLVEEPPLSIATLAFAGPQPLQLREYLADLREALGEPRRQWVVAVPEGLFRSGASFAGHLPGSMLDAETADMLLAGNATQHNALPELLGRPPRPPRDFVPAAERELQRRAAVLDLWHPVLRLALALMWIWTAIVSFGLYPVQDSYALLARVGLQGALATVALYGAAALDLVLGVLTLAAPARWRRPVWLAQLALIGGYTVLVTFFLPEYWLHPYGPISKNLPVLALIMLLWALELPPRKEARR